MMAVSKATSHSHVMLCDSCSYRHPVTCGVEWICGVGMYEEQTHLNNMH